MSGWSDALTDTAEAMSLSAFDMLAKGERSIAFDGFAAWLAERDARFPLRRLAEGFVLETAAGASLMLLFAAATSEAVARQIAAASGGGRGVPVWLIQRLIPDFEIDALAAGGALRQFQIIGIEGDAPRIEARIWLSEPVLDRLCGVPACDPDVAAGIAPVACNVALASETVSRLLGRLLGERGGDRLSPVVLAGAADPVTVAASLAAIGLTPHVLAGSNIPDDPGVRDRLARAWSRDAALDSCALIVMTDERTAALAADFADRVMGHVVVAGPMAAGSFRRAVRVLVDSAATPETANERWRRALGPARSAKLGTAVSRIASQFRLAPADIDAVCARVASDVDAATPQDAARILWRAAGRSSPVAAVPGVMVVEPAYSWREIVLAPAIEAALRRVETHVRHAAMVMDEWGFAEHMGGRGRGVAALFAGPSGTGKTMAAEVLASSLDLRMMVIDLSQIISKYIGETSKNIAAAFDLAERLGAVMVWNEGDAIWGARGAVNNATDRHVNAEVGDLLQRIEQFRGFTIVTTNMRQAVDPAFLRRFRFIIDFPMPSERERLRLWRQAFPERAPVAEMSWTQLASLPLSGGSIRNVALGSAFLAAEAGGVIDRGLIWAELAEELRKNNLPVPPIDWGTTQ